MRTGCDGGASKEWRPWPPPAMMVRGATRPPRRRPERSTNNVPPPCARSRADHGLVTEMPLDLVGAPGVQEAAAVGVFHPKWDERPILLIVRKPGAEATEASILDYLKDKVAKWWLPDEIVFVDELPHTATGKILKRQIRDDYKDYKLRSLAEA